MLSLRIVITVSAAMAKRHFSCGKKELFSFQHCELLERCIFPVLQTQEGENRTWRLTRTTTFTERPAFYTQGLAFTIKDAEQAILKFWI